MLREPPDRSPRSPSFVVPPGAWDCHFHVFGPQKWYPLRRGLSVEHEDSTIEQYFQLQQTLGLSRGLLVQSGVHGCNYQHVLHLQYRYPERLRSVVMLAPDVTDTEISVLTQAGVVGIRFFPGTTSPDENLIARVRERGWLPHYLLRTDEQADAWAKQILASRGNFVIEHSGMPNWQQGIDGKRFALVLELMDTGRCWIKLSAFMSSAPPPLFADAIVPNQVLVNRFPSRVLWGSDWPHPSWPQSTVNDGDLLDLLRLWAPEESARTRILVDNPEALFGFR